jgi:hypothetical protein
VWLSADGTHDGLIEQDATAGQSSTDEILPGCHNGKAAFIGKDGKVVPGRFGPCLPTPAYRPGLPTDADGMLRHLRNGKGALTDADLFKMIADLLRESYLSPPQRAAVFEAASRLSGAVVVNDVADAAGRHGVAVAWTLMYPDPAKTPVKPSEGPPRPVAQDQLIFDKASYGYLGERTVFTADVLGEKAGAVDGQSAVLKVGIVDRVGQRP